MGPLICAWGFESKQIVLNTLFNARFKLAIIALTIQLLTFFAIMRPFSFLCVFNVPAALALLLCLHKGSLLNYKAQKRIKLLLKIGIAKTIGGVLLAIYMGLKYACMPSSAGFNVHYGHNREDYMKLCAIYFTASALVDILYSFIAKDIIKNTKEILTNLKEKKRERSPRSTSPRAQKSPGVALKTQEP